MNNLIFTLDVEEWYHSENIAPNWHKQFRNHSSLVTVTELLDILDEKGAKGTFFFLGTIAQENKNLVANVARRGHEIASHGWDHTLLHRMTKSDLYADIHKSTSTLEEIIGEKVVGYRSPCFSQSDFLIDALLLNGYTYTSNGISSTFHDRYSNNVMTKSAIHDFALPVASLGPFDLPATGGGWFRLFPSRIQNILLKASNQTPKVFYAHPVDFDSELPFLDFISIAKYFRQTVNLNKSLRKLSYFNFSNQPLKYFVPKPNEDASKFAY